MSERLSERERIKGLRRTDFNIALQRLAKSDCGDNSCIFAGKGKGGMRTNGGCRCYQMLTNDIVALIEADRARIVELLREFRSTLFSLEETRSYSYVIMVNGVIEETLKRAGGE